MNKKTEKLLNPVWYIVIMMPTKNSVIMMLYRGIGTSFKLGMGLTIIKMRTLQIL